MVGATSRINEIYKIIKIATTNIIFTGFIVRWEKLKCGIGMNIISVLANKRN